MILWIKMSIKIIINKQFDQPTNKEKYQTVIYAIYSTYIELHNLHLCYKMVKLQNTALRP